MSQQHENRLVHETSPYLLQHAHNPVDWYPWGPEALERARDENKLIFLSIGYSACHWCHVMERESFENDKIAAFMNEHFVNVKVDREERPDLDEIYMHAVQQLTGSGGWPMSVFLTPTLKPCFGGTYFPPFSMHGRPGFADVLASLSRTWQQAPERLTDQAERLTHEIQQTGERDTRDALSEDILDQSLAHLQRNFDPSWGGFGDAPKFPHALDIRMALRHHLRTGRREALHMATFTLDKMANGGIFDHLGGGFHRYSTDEQWLIPHFEKMLYDNALLIPAYLEAYLVTREERFAAVVERTIEWAMREMLNEDGTFASAQDADTEGEEGRFFAWTPEELNEVLGPKLGGWAQEWFAVTPEGNFEHGTSALWRPEEAEVVAQSLGVDVDELTRAMADAQTKLFETRAKRVAPGLDDKALTAWNGLMISALAQATQVLEQPEPLAAAQRAAKAILETMRQPNGRLYATQRLGRAHEEGCLDDYAFLIQGLLDLYETDFDPTWIERALELEEILARDFFDEKNGGYFTTGNEHEKLIARMKNPHDGALPAGNGVQTLNLLRLAELTGKPELAQRAQATILSLGALINRYPSAFSQMLCAVDFLHAKPREIVLAGSDAGAVDELVRVVRQTFLPQRVVARATDRADAKRMPLFEGRLDDGARSRAWVCRNYTCQAPVDRAEELRDALA